MTDGTGRVWINEVVQMSVAKMNMFLVAMLQVVSAVALFAGGVMLARGYVVQAVPTLFVGCLLTVAMAARSIRLQEENDRYVGDFLDSITPTMHSGPPVEAFRSTLPPAPKVPRIETWHGKRGVS